MPYEASKELTGALEILIPKSTGLDWDQPTEEEARKIIVDKK